jgi:DNA polymerase-3 subunit delta'
MFTPERGGIIITHAFEERCAQLVEQLKPLRSVCFMADDFKIEDAKEVIAEAYKSEASTKTLILGAKSFTIPAQNSLLKILEEPPRNIIFILLAPNKSTFLPTIRSRMTLHSEHEERQWESMSIKLASLDLASLFAWVKEHDKLKKHEAKELLEALFYHAVHCEKIVINKAQLECFEKAFKLIELNARVQSVLVMVLMNFLSEAKRAR